MRFLCLMLCCDESDGSCMGRVDGVFAPTSIVHQFTSPPQFKVLRSGLVGVKWG